MSPSTDLQTDPAATIASLAAEAVLLQGRLVVLREAIHTVDARIDTVSETLGRLLRPPTGPTGGADGPGRTKSAGSGLR
ncbi:MAG TPA: hypothetical protein VIS09_15365 [Streptomyces sp.]